MILIGYLALSALCALLFMYLERRGTGQPPALAANVVVGLLWPLALFCVALFGAMAGVARLREIWGPQRPHQAGRDGTQGPSRSVAATRPGDLDALERELPRSTAARPGSAAPNQKTKGSGSLLGDPEPELLSEVDNDSIPN